MSNTSLIFSERKKFLRSVKDKKEEALLVAPIGKLRVNSHENHVQFYHKIDPHDPNGKYISVKNKVLAKKLAQKEYDQKIIDVATQEIKAIEKYESVCPKILVEDVYDSFTVPVKIWLNPL